MPDETDVEPTSPGAAAASPSPDPPEPEREPDEVLDGWERDLRALADADDLLDLDDASPLVLDLDAAHPSGIASFLAGRETLLSTLFREPAQLSEALRRARAIRVASARLVDDLGLEGSRLATGLLVRRAEPGVPALRAPVLLRPLTLVPRGASDFELVARGEPRLNPALARLLPARGRGQEVPGVDLARLTPLLERLGGRVHDRTLVGALADVGPGLAADLRDRRRSMATHPVVGKVLGTVPTERTGLAAAAPRTPRSERLDRTQRAALDALAAGDDVRLLAPPGSGATEVAAAAVEQAHAHGLSVLVVAPQRPELEAVRRRLAEPVPASREAGAVTARAELHRPQHPWGRSRVEVLRRLVELGADPGDPALTRGRDLSPRTLRALASDRAREEAAALMVRAGEVDAYEEVARTSPWKGADLTDDEEAVRTLEVVRRLREERLPAARDLVASATTETGLGAGTTLADWGRRLDLLVSVRHTLDVFTPAVYERQHTEIIQATANARWRKEHGVDMSVLERRRWRQEGEALVRPGMRVPDLHSALVRARTELGEWQELSGATDGTAAPSAPADLVDADAAYHRVLEDLQLLEAVLADTEESSGLDELDVDHLLARLARLHAAADDLRVLPARNRLLADLDALGLTALVNRLAAQRADRARVADELEIAWYAGVLDEMDTSGPGWEVEADSEVPTDGDAPVRTSTTLALPELGDRVHDVVVVLQAHRTRVAEGALALVRGRQALVVGDPDGAPPAPLDLGARGDVSAPSGEPGASLLDATRDRLSTLVLARVHDRPRELVAAPPRPQSLPAALPAPRPHPLVLSHVPDATVPVTDDGSDPVPQAEVVRLVALVGEHARQHPDRSLAVLTVRRAEAVAVADLLRRTLREDPDLARWVGAGPEPFVVTDLRGAHDTVRDQVLLGIGVGRTPHGRVLHRFGALDDAAGTALLRLGATRARAALTVVAGVRADDLDPERLGSPGARALRDLLRAAEDAGPPGPDPQSDGSPHDALLARLADALGAAGHTAGPAAAQAFSGWLSPDLVVTRDDGARVALTWDGTAVGDGDTSLAAEHVHEQRLLAGALRRLGWRVVLTTAEQVARDVEGVVAQVARA